MILRKKGLQVPIPVLLFGVGPITQLSFSTWCTAGTQTAAVAGPCRWLPSKEKGPWRTNTKEHRKKQFSPMASYTQDQDQDTGPLYWSLRLRCFFLQARGLTPQHALSVRWEDTRDEGACWQTLPQRKTQHSRKLAEKSNWKSDSPTLLTYAHLFFIQRHLFSQSQSQWMGSFVF